MYEEIENSIVDKIGEVSICNDKKIFEFYNVDYEYLSPYDFKTYFNRKISFNKFTHNITFLMNYYIEIEELIHCRKYYGKHLIKNKRLDELINNSDYNDFISMIVIIKRLEYLSDYLEDESFEATYIIYLNNIIEVCRKNKKKYIDENF